MQHVVSGDSSVTDWFASLLKLKIAHMVLGVFNKY